MVTGADVGGTSGVSAICLICSQAVASSPSVLADKSSESNGNFSRDPRGYGLVHVAKVRTNDQPVIE